MQEIDIFRFDGLDGYRLILKLSTYLYSREENIQVLPEQNTQILVRMHEVQVLHQMKIRKPTFSGRARIDRRIFAWWCQGSVPKKMATDP
jgi:predicted deacetylase